MEKREKNRNILTKSAAFINFYMQTDIYLQLVEIFTLILVLYVKFLQFMRIDVGDKVRGMTMLGTTEMYLWTDTDIQLYQVSMVR